MRMMMWDGITQLRGIRGILGTTGAGLLVSELAYTLGALSLP